MIKLYDDQKLEVIKELKKYYEASVKYVEDLRERAKTEDWISYINLDNYETQNNKLLEFIEDIEKDYKKIDDEKWNSLLVFLNISTPPTPYNFESKTAVENKDNNAFGGMAGVIGLIAVAALFGGGNWLKAPIDDLKDNKNLN